MKAKELLKKLKLLTKEELDKEVVITKFGTPEKEYYIIDCCHNTKTFHITIERRGY